MAIKYYSEQLNQLFNSVEELQAAELYTAGQEIKINIGWAKGALTSDDNAQAALMNKDINAAAQEAGFGEITLEAVGSINDRYGDVPAGEYAVGVSYEDPEAVFCFLRSYFRFCI